MSYRHGKKWVVVMLKAGESIRPIGLKCVYVYCRRTMMKVNRDVELVLDNNKGLHWSDVPDDITVIEHKCRGCDFYYKIYTPKTLKASEELVERLNKTAKNISSIV